MKRIITAFLFLIAFAAPMLAQQEILKDASSYTLLFGPMIDSSDHIAPKTGISSFSLIKIAKCGGTTVATPSGTVSEVDATNMPGWYMVAGNATNTGCYGEIALHAEASGADKFDTKVGTVVGYDPRSVPTVAAMAAEVRDTLCSGASTSASLGKKVCALPDATAGASGGVVIDGSNAAITFTALTVSGALGVNGNADITASQIVRSGTAQAGSSTTITLDASASATNNLYAGDLVVITGSTGVGQVRTILSYVGSTKVATVSHMVNGLQKFQRITIPKLPRTIEKIVL